MIKFLHLAKNQLSLNGESGNLDVLVARLRWSNVASQIQHFEGAGDFPSQVDAVFIGSGTLAGALEALEALRPHRLKLQEFASQKVPFLAFGLGWEILGESVKLPDGELIQGLGVFPSRSVRGEVRASRECFGYDEYGNLTTGYANHSAEIELIAGAKPLIELTSGFGNSSIRPASEVPGEGLIQENLMASRLNGPLLAINPHIADRFIELIGKRVNFEYKPSNENAIRADEFARFAREELKKRLAS